MNLLSPAWPALLSAALFLLRVAKKRTTYRLPATLAVLLLLALVVTGCGAPNPPVHSGDPNSDSGWANRPGSLDNRLAVHFIDVGQGDAILIQTGNKNVLIDGGSRGDDTVVNYLLEQEVGSLDLVIGTHPHEDHIGGLISVLQSIPVKEVLDPGVPHTSGTFEDYLNLIDRKDIPFTVGRAGMEKDLGGGITMHILHPVSPAASDLNNASIVARIEHGRISFLLTGDAEEGAENQMLGSGHELNSTVLKIGHHGSRTGTTSAFLEAVDPEFAVIMCGADNSYGHPHRETLQKLEEKQVNIFRTDLHGTIVFITDGETLNVNTQSDSPPAGHISAHKVPQSPVLSFGGSYWHSFAGLQVLTTGRGLNP